MNQQMNALVFCENKNRYIRKPNGLEYTFENVDKPALGFEFDVVVYDDIEMKIMEWIPGKRFEDQEQVALNDMEKELCEQYISNSEAPEDINLQSQYAEKLNFVVREQHEEVAQLYGFRDLQMVLIAGREGSNHPARGNARRVLEYIDNTHNVYFQIRDEIFSTKEELLKDFEHYRRQIPAAAMATGHVDLGQS